MSETTGERIVTIFGGAKCAEDDPEYAQARRLGQLLADAGFTICTGGYLGVMEAASRGAHERGGRVLGRMLTDQPPSLQVNNLKSTCSKNLKLLSLLDIISL